MRSCLHPGGPGMGSSLLQWTIKKRFGTRHARHANSLTWGLYSHASVRVPLLTVLQGLDLSLRSI